MSRLLGMIMESLVETPDPSMMEMDQRDEMSADKMAMESLGGIGELPEANEEPVVESYVPEVRVMSAVDALAAIEANIEVKTGLPVEMNDPESIFKALESELPTEKAPYDPTAELDDISKVLAGLDADDDMSPDQPQPDEKVESDMDVANLINENQDKEQVEDAGRIDHATESAMFRLKDKLAHLKRKLTKEDECKNVGALMGRIVGESKKRNISAIELVKLENGHVCVTLCMAGGDTKLGETDYSCEDLKHYEVMSGDMSEIEGALNENEVTKQFTIRKI